MNKARRKRLNEYIAELERIKDGIESVMNDEQDALDNLPDGLQGSERADAMNDACDEMDNAIDYVGDAIEALNAAI